MMVKEQSWDFICGFHVCGFTKLGCSGVYIIAIMFEFYVIICLQYACIFT